MGLGNGLVTIQKSLPNQNLSIVAGIKNFIKNPGLELLTQIRDNLTTEDLHSLIAKEAFIPKLFTWYMSIFSKYLTDDKQLYSNDKEQNWCEQEKEWREPIAALAKLGMIQHIKGKLFSADTIELEMRDFENKKIKTLKLAEINNNGIIPNQIDRENIKEAKQWLEKREALKALIPDLVKTLLEKIHMMLPQEQLPVILLSIQQSHWAMLAELLRKMPMSESSAMLIENELNAVNDFSGSNELRACYLIINKIRGSWVPSNSNNWNQVDYLKELFSDYFPRNGDGAKKQLNDIKLEESINLDADQITRFLSTIIGDGYYDGVLHLLKSAENKLICKIIEKLPLFSWQKMYDFSDNWKGVNLLFRNSLRTISQETMSQILDNCSINFLDYFSDTLGFQRSLTLYEAYSDCFDSAMYENSINNIKKSVKTEIAEVIAKDHNAEIKLTGKIINSIIDGDFVNKPKFFAEILLKENFPLADAYAQIMSDNQLEALVRNSVNEKSKLFERLILAYIFRTRSDCYSFVSDFSFGCNHLNDRITDKVRGRRIVEYRSYTNDSWADMSLSEWCDANLRYKNLNELNHQDHKDRFVKAASLSMIRKFAKYIPHDYLFDWKMDISTTIRVSFLLNGFLYNNNDYLVEFLISHSPKNVIAEIFENIIINAKNQNQTFQILMNYIGKSADCFKVINELYSDCTEEQLLKKLEAFDDESVRPEFVKLLFNNNVGHGLMRCIFNYINKDNFERYMKLIGTITVRMMKKNEGYSVYALALFEFNQKYFLDNDSELYLAMLRTSWPDNARKMALDLIAAPQYETSVSLNIDANGRHLYPPVFEHNPPNYVPSPPYVGALPSAPVIIDDTDTVTNASLNPSCSSNQESLHTKLDLMSQQLNEQKVLTQTMLNALKSMAQINSSREGNQMIQPLEAQVNTLKIEKALLLSKCDNLQKKLDEKNKQLIAIKLEQKTSSMNSSSSSENKIVRRKSIG